MPNFYGQLYTIIALVVLACLANIGMLNILIAQVKFFYI